MGANPNISVYDHLEEIAQMARTLLLRSRTSVPREKIRNSLIDRERVITRWADQATFDDVIAIGFFGNQL